MIENSTENTSSESEETVKMTEEKLRPETAMTAEGETETMNTEMNEPETNSEEISEPVQEQEHKSPENEEQTPELEQPVSENTGMEIPDVAEDPIESHSVSDTVVEEPEVAAQTLEMPIEEKQAQVIEERQKPETIDEIPEDVDLQHDEETHPEEDEQHEEAHDDFWFDGMSRENLLEFVTEAIAHSEERNMNKKVMQARSAFNKLAKEALEEAMEKWKTDGLDENDFVWEDGTIREDFNKAFKAYKKSREGYINNLNIEKEKNLVTKKELLETLKAFVENSDNLSNISQFKKLQEDWRKTGHVPIGDAENVWNSYNYFVNKFYEQRALYSEFKELDNKRNHTAKEEIIAKIEALNAIEDVEEAFRMLRGYQDDWKHIGPVPKEKRDEINLRFRNAVIPVYERKEKLSDERHKISEQNFEAKLALMAKIEEIADYQSERPEDWVNKNQELSQWIENWRSIGSIPFKKNDELKERLSLAIRKFNKSKNDFFKVRKQEKSQNLAKKVELCEKAEAFANGENPSSHRKDIIQLQEEWKNLGTVPFQHTDKLKNRFRAACNSVFEKIADSHKEMDKGQKENLRLKTEIAEKIEAMIQAEKPQISEEDINKFQDDFAAIGHVPYAEKDNIRKRFYAALNKVIAKTGGKEEKNRQHADPALNYRLTIQKWSKDSGGYDRIENEERKNSRDLKRIEGEIATLENNIEFFRNSKNADDLRAKMNKEISDLKGKMADIQEKIKVIRATARR